MRLDRELLAAPPAAGARVLALARLADADEAAARLGARADAEALRDYRVAVRRLRSTVRLLAPGLRGVLSGEQRRWLGQAARLTEPARDAEVLLAWLGGARGRLGAPYRGALDWFLDRAEQRRAVAAREVVEEALPGFRHLSPRLARRFSSRPAAIPGGPPNLAGLLAGVLRAQVLALREALAKVVGGEDSSGLRRARLEAKRLRHLLEPLSAVPGADATGAVDALEGLRELLGGWRDRQQVREALAGALLEVAADRARRGRGAASGDLRPGLLAMDQLAEREAAGIYRQLAERHLGPRAAALLDPAWAVVAGLEEAAGQPGPAERPAERRLLLTGLPAEAGGGEIVETALGWLPDGLEHVGRVQSAMGDGWFRARPGPRGSTELDAISRADFEAWWPLTEGRRLSRRRHHLQGLPGWTFEDFTDRRLTLAVIEPGTDARPPAWLEPAVVREVTGERGYRDEVLARRGARRAR